jgi:hypothetical protein
MKIHFRSRSAEILRVMVDMCTPFAIIPVAAAELCRDKTRTYYDVVKISGVVITI